MCYHDVKSPEIKKQCNSLARKSKPDLMKSPPFILMYKVKKKKKVFTDNSKEIQVFISILHNAKFRSIGEKSSA